VYMVCYSGENISCSDNRIMYSLLGAIKCVLHNFKRTLCLSNLLPYKCVDCTLLKSFLKCKFFFLLGGGGVRPSVQVPGELLN
jgi:hypothetical protein